MASELLTEQKPGKIEIIRITAEDASDPPSFRETLLQLDVDETPEGYVINLAGVRLVPSEILSALVVLHRHVPNRVKLCHVHPNILEMLNRTQLTQIFEVCDDEGVALGRLSCC